MRKSIGCFANGIGCEKSFGSVLLAETDAKRLWECLADRAGLDKSGSGGMGMSDLERYNDRLRELQEKMGRRNRLETLIKSLDKQRRELDKKVIELQVSMEKEEEDVKRLEGHSLANFFHALTGQAEKKLEKEKQEAYEAAVKYETAVQELQSVERDLRAYREEFASVRDSQAEYDRLLAEKADYLKASGAPEAEEMLRLEQEIGHLRSQRREVEEALEAGRGAKATAEAICRELDSAAGWGTWDLVGGGLVSDLAKHGHLDEAQELVTKLQIQLRQFRTELADVELRADMQVNIDGFLRFADYFFDGLFADWTVLNRIHDSQERVQETRKQIGDVLNRLNAMHGDLTGQLDGKEKELKRLVREAF